MERTLKIQCGTINATVHIDEENVSDNPDESTTTHITFIQAHSPTSNNNTGSIQEGHDLNNSAIYDPVSVLSAFHAGTHFLHAQFEILGSGVTQRPTGGLWLSCMPIAKPDQKQKVSIPHQKHAIVQILNANLNNNELIIRISALVRSRLLPQLLASQQRQQEINKAMKKSRKNRNAQVIEPIPLTIPLPVVPPEIQPLSISCTKGSRFKRVNMLMIIRGHRILFLEPSHIPYINKRLYWEARLLYPNYPNTNKNDSHDNEQLIEGIHYTLLMSYSDSSICCCGLMKCCGATGAQGKCQIKFPLISSLASLASPNSPPPVSPTELNQPQVNNNNHNDITDVEITLSLLAMIPTVTKFIHWRNQFVYVMIPAQTLGLIAIIINIIRWII